MQDLQSEKEDTILEEERTGFLLLLKERTRSVKLDKSSFLNISFLPDRITKTLVPALVCD